MYKRMLVPLDGSEISEHSLIHVKEISIGQSELPEIKLLEVIEPIPLVVEPEAAEMVYKQHPIYIKKAKEYLIRIAEDLKKEGLSVDVAVIEGSPAEVILDYTKKNSIDVIVMSTHGRSGISRWAVGSITDKIIRHSSVPILVAPPKEFRDS